MTNNDRITRLLIALDDADRTVRQEAALALGGVHDQRVADALVDRLGRERECFVRETLTWATVQQADAAAAATPPAASPAAPAAITTSRWLRVP